VTNFKYPTLIAPFTFGEGYDYEKYLEDQSHFDNLASDVDQSIAKLAFSNAEVARLSMEHSAEMTQTIVEGQQQISQGMDSIRVGIERLDDSIVDLRQSVDDVRWAIDEVRYSIESGFQLTAQRLSAIEGVLRDILETVKSPEKTWALEKYDIAKELYRRELYEDALSYLNDALNGHDDHRGYVFDPRVHMLKGNILLGDGENFEPDLIDFPAAKECFEEAVKYAKPPRDMLKGADEKRREELFEPRVFARCCSAWASYIQGDIGEAERTYREAIKEGPNDARSLYYLGKVLAHQNRFEEAEKFLDRAIRVNFFYVAKLSTDTDYLKDRDRFEKRVSDYRVELLDRLKSFAEVLCLLQGSKAKGLFSGNWKYDHIKTIDLSQTISARNAEIGPMVSHYDQLKRDALQAKGLIEEVAQQTEHVFAAAQNQKGNIRMPSDSDIGNFDSEGVTGKHRTIGWSIAGGGFVLAVFTDGGLPALVMLVAVGYALLGAPLVGGLAKSEHKKRELDQLSSKYRSRASAADSDIRDATQKRNDARDILNQLNRLAPTLSEASH
jgi:tetratricopeptide (TPR) repeat protein